MKKIILIGFWMFMLQSAILSQNEFGAVGSFWKYGFESHSGGGYGWTIISIEKDTVVNGENYKIFKRKHHYKPMIEPAIERVSRGLLQIKDNVVFYNEKVLLDFDMALTDSLYLSDVGEAVDIQLAIDSITIEEIDGFEYKKWHGQKICINGGNGIGPYEPFTILETVGQIDRGYLFYNFDGCAIGGGTNTFGCYKNGDFTYPPGAICEELFLTSTDDLIKEDIEIYPNPVSSILYLKLEDATMDEVFLSTLDGKEIFHHQGKSHSLELAIGHLEPGMYLMKIRIKDQFLMKKIIKI